MKRGLTSTTLKELGHTCTHILTQTKGKINSSIYVEPEMGDYVGIESLLFDQLLQHILFIHAKQFCWKLAP